MLPCACSVIDHRWRQDVVKTKKWHTNLRQVRHWCFYRGSDGPTAKWNLFVLYNDQKRKKTDTHTCHVPLDCLRICASLGSINLPNAYFRPCFFSLSLPYLFTVSSEKNSTSFLAQSRIMTKTFLQNSESRSGDTQWQLLWRFLEVRHSQVVKGSFCLCFSIFLLRK